MAVATSSFTIDIREWVESMRKLDKNTSKSIYSFMKRKAVDCEKYMKDKAPWQDRTGNARKSLSARMFSERNIYTIELENPARVQYGPRAGHWYGIYLEYAMGKRFAILEPTVDEMATKVLEDLKGKMAEIYNNALK